MKKTALSFVLTLFCALGLLAGNADVSAASLSREAGATESVATVADGEFIDYAGLATLDLNADSKTMEVTVKTFVDGDTTHFNADGFNSQNLLKARYAAVNTPESTGQIEEWGKKAARFTRERLESATSIVIESDGSEWKPDSTGERYLSWVWYKAPNSDVYRNLNLELLQQGLAVGSKASESRYGDLAIAAIAQATEFKLNIHSKEKDPDFFYGDSIEIDLKELRLNIQKYEGDRVAFEGVVAYYFSQGVYVEDFDEETQMYYGIYVYYGFNFVQGSKLLQVGNKVRITGIVSYYEAGGTYQVSDLKYSAYSPSDDDVRLIEKNHSAANVETTAETYTSTVDVKINEYNEDGEVVNSTTKKYKYAELAMNTSLTMKGLYVKDVYTTQNGGDNDGAMTLTCLSDGKTITVRTIVLRSADGRVATEDMLKGKIIDVTGIIEYFSGDYQIKILSNGAIKVDGEPLFPPVAPTPSTPSTPTVPETSDTTSDSGDDASASGCFGAIGVSAMIPMAAAAFVCLKKRKN